MSNNWLIPASTYERDILIAQAERARREYEFATQRLRQLDVIDSVSSSSGPMTTPTVTSTSQSTHSVMYPVHSMAHSAHGHQTYVNHHKYKQESVYLGLDDQLSHMPNHSTINHNNWHYSGDSAPLYNNKPSQSTWQHEYAAFGSIPGSINSHWMPSK